MGGAQVMAVLMGQNDDETTAFGGSVFSGKPFWLNGKTLQCIIVGEHTEICCICLNMKT
jgi:hypothetical protein